MHSKLEEVEISRRENEDAFHFNWLLNIQEDFQAPFKPTHENMANLNLHKNQATEQYQEIMDQLDVLLTQFVTQKRMKISGDYQPCYELID